MDKKNVCQECGGRGVIWLGEWDGEDHYETCEKCGGRIEPIEQQVSALEMQVRQLKGVAALVDRYKNGKKGKGK